MKKTLLSLLIVPLTIGCSSIKAPSYSKNYTVSDDFNIYVENVEKIKDRFSKYDKEKAKRVEGFWVREKGIQSIHVPVTDKIDRNGNNLPDFYILGHEIWHLKELGGKYHK